MFFIETSLNNLLTTINNIENLKSEQSSNCNTCPDELLISEVKSRISSDTYSNDKDSIANTIRYVYNIIRSGIYVQIENNKLKYFIPFANPNYTNRWSSNVKLYGSSSNNINEFSKTRKRTFRYDRNYIKDMSLWWANAFIVNNEVRDDVWGQHSLQQYSDLLKELLHYKMINDVSFIINKRDHPILRKDLKDPYTNFYKTPTNIPIDYQSSGFIPILSPYSNVNYLDIPFIIPEDYLLSCNDPDYYQMNKSELVNWSSKKNIIFFRGSATGSMELKYNQRLQITKLSNDWKHKSPKILDAGIVSWNSRDKIDSNFQINYIKPNVMAKNNIYLTNRVPMDEQSKFKFILNIDGHSRPNRTSYLLGCGSVIFHVETKYVVGNVCWYDNLLKPYIHYIPIKHDFSDLRQKYTWCLRNDDKCRQIVKNARRMYEYIISKQQMFNYCEYLFNNIKTNS